MVGCLSSQWPIDVFAGIYVCMSFRVIRFSPDFKAELAQRCVVGSFVFFIRVGLEISSHAGGHCGEFR